MKFLNLEPDKEKMFMTIQRVALFFKKKENSQEIELKGRAKQGIIKEKDLFHLKFESKFEIE